MYQVEWSPRSIKQMLKIEQRYRSKISDKASELKGFPSVKHIKELEGKRGHWRLRVGDYRVLFRLVKGKAKVIRIEQVKRRTTTTY